MDSRTPSRSPAGPMVLTYSSAIQTTTTLSSTDPSSSATRSHHGDSIDSGVGSAQPGRLRSPKNGSTLSTCGAKALSGAGTNSSTHSAAPLLAPRATSPSRQPTPRPEASRRQHQLQPACGGYTHQGDRLACDKWVQQLERVGSRRRDAGCLSGDHPVSGYGNAATVSNVTVYLNNATGSNGIAGQFLLVAPGGGSHNLDFLDEGFSESNTSGTTLCSLTPPGSRRSATKRRPRAITRLPTTTLPRRPSRRFSRRPWTTAFRRFRPPSTFPQPEGGPTRSLSRRHSRRPGRWRLVALHLQQRGPQPDRLVRGPDAEHWRGDHHRRHVQPQSDRPPELTRTFTATVTDANGAVTSGSVTFLDTAPPLPAHRGGNNVQPLNGSGVATFQTSALTEGDPTRSRRTTAARLQTTGQRIHVAALRQRINGKVVGRRLFVLQCGGVLTAQGQSGAFTPPRISLRRNFPARSAPSP